MKNAFEYEAELSALREELSRVKTISDNNFSIATDRYFALKAAEQRNALPSDWADQMFAELERRFELSKKYHQDHLVNDDTQIGVEFAIEWITATLKPIESGASE